MKKRNWNTEIQLDKATHRLTYLLVVKKRNRELRRPNNTHTKEWWMTLSDREIEIVDEETRNSEMADEQDGETSFSEKYSDSYYLQGMIYRDPVVIARRKYLKEFVVLP